MKFTYDNHLKYHINNKLYSIRQSETEKFKVSVGSIDPERYAVSNYNNELIRSASLIHQDLGDDVVLFLSGGTDSEIVARSFVKLGIKPKCYTIKFKDDYNISDVKEATTLARELGLSLTYIDFDLKHFLYSGEAIEFGKELQCSQLTYLMVYHSIKKIGAPSIMGGEALLRRNVNITPMPWYYCFREDEDASAMRFSLKYNIPLVNEFFSYTPELLLYYLEDNDIKHLVQTQYNYKLTSVSSKNSILKKLCPDITVRKKTHGFEQLTGFNYEANRELFKNIIPRLESSLDGINYNEVINMLKGTHDSN
jgi:hypothetical protein